MRLKKYILLILFFASISSNMAEAQVAYRAPESKNTEQVRTATHTVKMGETAYSIATAYKTTVEEIYRLNPGSSSRINVGQELTVPSTTTQTVANQDNSQSFKHIILAKETLFSVSQKYKITIAELLKVNPGLSASTFSIGKEINIPLFVDSPQAPATNNTQLQHKVEKQETLYSISKKYNCTITEILNNNPIIKEQGLKEGTIISIPTNASTVQQDGLNAVTTNSLNYYLPEDGVVRVALLLPFIKGSKTVPVERITEYYEGFLLAVQRMKEKGLNAEIYTFDIGSDNDTRRLESILGTNELNSLNLIIGGISEKQVHLISKFSQSAGIKYVVPFSNKDTGVNNNKNIFQVANTHTNLFPKVVRAFKANFANANIVFLNEVASDNNKADFVKELQKGLKDASISYRTAPSTASITADLNSVMDKTKKNIIIPTSSSEATLNRILEAMPIVTKNNTDISLFGYPEWQAYINQSKKLHQYDSYIYSMFYLDTAHPEAQLFADKYKRWYNKNFIAAIPRYAHMGYDTGMIFLTALQRLGHDFSSRIGELNTPTLQSALYFEAVGIRGGYINNGIYLINLKPNGDVIKTDISR